MDIIERFLVEKVKSVVGPKQYDWFINNFVDVLVFIILAGLYVANVVKLWHSLETRWVLS